MADPQRIVNARGAIYCRRGRHLQQAAAEVSIRLRARKLARFVQARFKRMRTKSLVFVGAALLVLLACARILFAPPQLSSDADMVMNSLSLQPGEGINVSDAKLYDRPMAYALYASAAVKLHKMDKAREAADWLVHSTADPSKTGWGLTEAWDAFADGSINPPSTVYGITVALVVNALFDVYDVTQNTTYLEVARRALIEYAAHFQLTDDGGYFWYSDQPSDDIDTANVSAMLMGQYARAARETHDESLMTIARLAHAHLVSSRRIIGDSWYWTYATSLKSADVNDLVHHALIVKGLMDYRRYSGDQTGIKEALNYFSFFRNGETINQFPRHRGVSDELPVRPARAWAIGMLAYVESRAQNPIDAGQAVKALRRYKTGRAGVYGQFPGEKAWLPDMQAYVLYGLAEYETAYGGVNVAR